MTALTTWRTAAACALVALALACRDPSAPCQANSECRENELCVLERCHTVCTSNQQCTRTDVCRDGICWPDEGTPVSDAAGLDGSADRTGADQAIRDASAVDRWRPDQATPDASADGAPGQDALFADASFDRTAWDRAPDSATFDAGAADSTVADTTAPDTTTVCTRASLQFDGVDDFAETPDAVDLDGMSEVTVEVWVYTTAAIDVTTRMRIVSHHASGPYDGYSLSIYLGAASFMIGRSTGYTSAAASFNNDPFIPNQWHHLAGTYDGTTVRLFVDGSMRATASLADPILDHAGPLTIGMGATDRLYPFVGMIDEVRVSKTARYSSDFTPPAVAASPDAETIALWHFAAGDGQTAADATGNGHSATLGTSTGVDQTDPSWVTTPCIGDRF